MFQNQSTIKIKRFIFCQLGASKSMRDLKIDSLFWGVYSGKDGFSKNWLLTSNILRGLDMRSLFLTPNILRNGFSIFRHLLRNRWIRLLTSNILSGLEMWVFAWMVLNTPGRSVFLTASQSTVFGLPTSTTFSDAKSRNNFSPKSACIKHVVNILNVRVCFKNKRLLTYSECYVHAVRIRAPLVCM